MQIRIGTADKIRLSTKETNIGPFFPKLTLIKPRMANAIIMPAAIIDTIYSDIRPRNERSARGIVDEEDVIIDTDISVNQSVPSLAERRTKRCAYVLYVPRGVDDVISVSWQK